MKQGHNLLYFLPLLTASMIGCKFTDVQRLKQDLESDLNGRAVEPSAIVGLPYTELDTSMLGRHIVAAARTDSDSLLIIEGDVVRMFTTAVVADSTQRDDIIDTIIANAKDLPCYALYHGVGRKRLRSYEPLFTNITIGNINQYTDTDVSKVTLHRWMLLAVVDAEKQPKYQDIATGPTMAWVFLGLPAIMIAFGLVGVLVGYGLTVSSGDEIRSRPEEAFRDSYDTLSAGIVGAVIGAIGWLIITITL